ncbi:hypothetical protein J4772_22635 [Cohnella sp. LGH]|uniref:glycosyl hydrolase family 28-related protein n=1 Tax=Cohnella sp. LGH TaxID=1619153 RepID=UPI001ADB505F|nr:glycosyl hydrolase family 28-related protein [Cohnella sp. LGH]QTH40375.1 hypothetical protein J4772_22635 [Cohnella sp. LGH]
MENMNDKESEKSASVSRRQFLAYTLAGTAALAAGGAFSPLTAYAQGGEQAAALTVSSDTISVKDFGAVGDGVTDDTAALTDAADYVNAIANTDGTPVQLYFPNGTYRYSSGLYFNRPVILCGSGGAKLVYEGTAHAVKLGKDGIGYNDPVNPQTKHEFYGVRDLILSGGANAQHGIYVNTFVVNPRIDRCVFKNFGSAAGYAIFFQSDNWNCYVTDCMYESANDIAKNFIRANGKSAAGVSDNGNSRLNVVDCFANIGGTTAGGTGVYVSGWKSVIHGGGFQGFKYAVHIADNTNYVEVDSTYVETIYSGCEAVIAMGDQPTAAVSPFYVTGLKLKDMYVNLHNVSNDYVSTDTKFLVCLNDKIALRNADISVDVYMGGKYPLLLLNPIAGQSGIDIRSTGNPKMYAASAPSTPLLSDAERAVNYGTNTWFDIWQRGNGASYTIAGSGIFKVADRYYVSRDGIGGSAAVTKETFAPGQTAVPGHPSYFLRLTNSQTATGATYHTLINVIEDVTKLSGERASLSLYLRCSKSISLQPVLAQIFGSGGSSATYTSAGTTVIGTSFAKVVFTFDVPRVDGKTWGANHRLEMHLSLPVNQTFTLDWGPWKLNKGEYPTENYRPDKLEELRRCKAFYEKGNLNQLIATHQRGAVHFASEKYRQPNCKAHVVYQDGSANYNSVVSIFTTTDMAYTLNAMATDSSVDWEADAELV